MDRSRAADQHRDARVPPRLRGPSLRTALRRRLYWSLRPRVPRLRGTRDVLLVARSPLMGRYARLFHELFEDDPRLRFHVTTMDLSEPRASRLAASLGLPRVDEASAVSRWWDLAVFPNHATVRRFRAEVPKFYTRHGVSSGKTPRGRDREFGDEIAMCAGRPRYQRMFEASERVRARAVARNPRLADVITVVGDLRVDRMLALLPSRAALRERLGLREDEIAVLVMSTWGPASLMERMGAALLRAAHRLASGRRYRFVVTANPLLLADGAARRRRWYHALLALRARGLLVVDPVEDWEPYLVAADAAIADHTSLALTYATLGRPLVFVPLDERECPPDAPIRRLAELCPVLRGPDALEPTLARALAPGAGSPPGRAARDICSYPGEAARRIRAVTYRELDLAARAGRGRRAPRAAGP